jgi:hypothetical protein
MKFVFNVGNGNKISYFASIHRVKRNKGDKVMKRRKNRWRVILCLRRTSGN